MDQRDVYKIQVYEARHYGYGFDQEMNLEASSANDFTITCDKEWTTEKSMSPLVTTHPSNFYSAKGVIYSGTCTTSGDTQVIMSVPPGYEMVVAKDTSFDSILLDFFHFAVIPAIVIGLIFAIFVI
jgi:hypothetical protein